MWLGLGGLLVLAAGSVLTADASVSAASSRSVAILLACLLVTLVIDLGLAYWLVRSIALPVARLVAILGR